MGIILQIDRLLRDIKPTPRTTLAKQLHDVALMTKRRSVIVLISDLLSEAADILAGLDHLIGIATVAAKAKPRNLAFSGRYPGQLGSAPEEGGDPGPGSRPPAPTVLEGGDPGRFL